MSGLTVIFDGNYLMNRSLYSYEQRSPIRLGTEEDCGMFMRKLATDVSYAVRSIGNVTRVIWTIDKNSWRRSIDTGNEGYKKNRTYEDTIDWGNFRKLNYEFGSILEKNGCICSVVDGCEGDDLIYFWSSSLHEAGEDVIVVTGDRDMNQLVKFEDNNFILIYNIKSSERKLVVPKNFKEWLDTPDDVGLFDMSALTSNKSTVNHILENIEFEEVDPKDVLYNKIVVGDVSDNVPPIVFWEETQKNGKKVNRKMTELKAAAIRENIVCNFGECDVLNLDKYAKTFSDKIREFYKRDVSEEEVIDRLTLNKKLVYLSEETIPYDVRDRFYEHFMENKEKGHPKITNWRMQVLMEGTKYFIEDKQIEVEADIFKAPKKTTKKKKDEGPSVDSLFTSLFN